MARANSTYTSSAASQQANGLKERYFEKLLKDNDLRIVDNPLLYRDNAELEKDVQEFHNDHQLKQVIDLPLLLRGAKFAQDARLFKQSVDSNSAEWAAICREEEPKLRDQTRALNTVLLTCCIAAVVQGWSQASITGANLQWPYAFGIAEPDPDPRKPNHTRYWTLGVVNAITFFAASSIGCWLSDPLNEHFWGRRGALFIAGVFTFAASIGSAFTNTWQTLFVCRLLLGIGYGAKASVVPIFESEVSPPKIRARLLVSWQTFTAVGIFLGSAVNLVFHGPHDVPPSLRSKPQSPPTVSMDTWRQQVAWRIQLASCAIPAIPLLCLAFLCSESPRWLAKKNQYAEAFKVLCGLRETPLLAARDLYYIYAQLRVETLLFSKDPTINEQLEDWSNSELYKQEAKRSSYWRRFVQLFTVSRNRRACLAAGIVMASQQALPHQGKRTNTDDKGRQLSGINIFAFLATTIFSGDDYSPVKSLWLSFGFAAANAVFSPIAYWIVDRPSQAPGQPNGEPTRPIGGRRFLLLASLIAMVPLLVATGFSFHIKSSIARNVVAEIFIILYTAAYSPGAGVIPFMYSSEIFPLINREAGMSFACSVNFVLAGVLALTVPHLMNSLDRTRLLCLFAGLDAAAAFLVWLFVPGTTEVTTLEQMNYIFGVPTKVHVQYQGGQNLRWTMRRYTPGLTPGQYIPLYYWNPQQPAREPVASNGITHQPTAVGLDHASHEGLPSSPAVPRVMQHQPLPDSHSG